MGRLRSFCFILFVCFNNASAEHKIVIRIFKFLNSIEARSSFEQNKPLLKLIFYNRNILFKELTQTNPPSCQIAQIFLKLAVFTSENFNKIAPRDRDFHFNKIQLKRFWEFIIKKIKLLLESQEAILWDIRFIKETYSHDTSDEEN